MLEGPIPATREALAKANLTIDDIDLVEVNEAFSSIPLAWAAAMTGGDLTKVHTVPIESLGGRGCLWRRLRVEFSVVVSRPHGASLHLLVNRSTSTAAQSLAATRWARRGAC
eukprot:6451727-Prymnesium_polylepis.2